MDNFFTQSPKISRKILVTGSNGQIGSALIPALYSKYGKQNVIASDKYKCNSEIPNFGIFIQLDVTKYEDIEAIIKSENINTIIHLAAILSSAGELDPLICREVNKKGFENCIDLAHKYKLTLFAPSSVGLFGEKCPKYEVPEDPVLLPTSIYGVTKVYVELLGQYYFNKFNVDFRSIRYPGVISSKEYEYHGTSDYSTEIFFEAIRNKKYICYLKENTPLPFLHIDDVVKATLKILDIESSKLSRRVYNLAGISLTPNLFYAGIKKFIPEFEIEYKPDHRQAIADSCPVTITDKSNLDWGWSYNITPSDLIEKLYKEVKDNEELRIAQGKKPINDKKR